MPASLPQTLPSLPFGHLLGVLVVIALLGKLALAYLHSASGKGHWGEHAVRRGLGTRLNRELYHSLHDLLLPTADGTSTQIDT